MSDCRVVAGAGRGSALARSNIAVQKCFAGVPRLPLAEGEKDALQPRRLRRACVPQQFVKVPPLGVLLPQDDGRVFLGRDGPLGLEHRARPLQAWDDRWIRSNSCVIASLMVASVLQLAATAYASTGRALTEQ